MPMGVINCCRGCVAPKRHTACWGSCPEYLAERAEYDRKKAIKDKERDIHNGIYYERYKKIYQAVRDRESAKKVKR